MHRALLCLLVVACGGKNDRSSSSTTPAGSEGAGGAGPAAATNEPLPPVTKEGDACRVSKDCNPLPQHRCMKTGEVAGCYPSPVKICDAPECSCFNNDPCLANGLGTCSGYQNGVVLCSKP